MSVEDIQLILKKFGDGVKALLNDLAAVTAVTATPSTKPDRPKDDLECLVGEIPAKVREDFNRSLPKVIDSVDKFFDSDDAVRMFGQLSTFLSTFLTDYAVTLIVQNLVRLFQ